MWLLRCGRENRWENRRADDPLQVAEAAKDLTSGPARMASRYSRSPMRMTASELPHCSVFTER